jgi:hypothetical protein
MSIEAMKLALEALINTTDVFLDTEGNHGALEQDAMDSNHTAITALRQAIEHAQKQEPYCWTWDEFVSGGKWRAEYGWKKPERQVTNLQPLYTSPPQHQWAGLTSDEISAINQRCLKADEPIYSAVRIAEAKLKEKNI